MLGSGDQFIGYGVTVHIRSLQFEGDFFPFFSEDLKVGGDRCIVGWLNGDGNGRFPAFEFPVRYQKADFVLSVVVSIRKESPLSILFIKKPEFRLLCDFDF